jgi:hypothetical protein
LAVFADGDHRDTVRLAFIEILRAAGKPPWASTRNLPIVCVDFGIGAAAGSLTRFNSIPAMAGTF